MSLLRIHLPASWPDAEPDAPLSWCRLGSRGEALESGRSPLAELPRADACELVIPAELVLLTHAVLPRGNRQKMRQLLPYAIEDKLVSEPEAVHVAAGPTLPDGQIAVAAVDKAWLGRVIARLEGQGLRPRRAWPETLLPTLPADGWVMAWDGRAGFLRSGEYAGMSLDDGSAAQPPAALVLSALHARTAGTLPRRLVLRLHDGAQPPDLDAWSRALGVTLEISEPWAPLQQPETPAGCINLLQGEFAPSAMAREWWPNLRLPLALAGLLALLHLGASALEWQQLRHEKRQLQAAMEQAFRQAFPEARVVVDAPLQMQRNLADLRRAAGQASPLDFVPLLSRAAAALDEVSRRSLRTIRYDASQLSLELALPDHAAADALLARLRSAGLACALQEGSGAQQPARIVITGYTQ